MIFQKSHNAKTIEQFKKLNYFLVILLAWQGIMGLASLIMLIKIGTITANLVLGVVWTLNYFVSGYLVFNTRRLGYLLPVGMFLLGLSQISKDFSSEIVGSGYFIALLPVILSTVICIFLYSKFFPAALSTKKQ